VNWSFLARQAKRKWVNWLRWQQFLPRRAETRRILNEILAQPHPGPLIIFMPGISWNLKLTQRPQHLAAALAQAGALVFYLEPQAQLNSQPILEVAPNLYWCNGPVQIFARVPSPWVYLLTWSIDDTPWLDRPRLLYDLVDDLAVFPRSAEENLAAHKERLERANLVLASARRLKEQIENLGRTALLCPNAVDFERFHRQPPPAAPANLSALRQANRPVIGYVGAIAYWMDFTLLDALVQLRPGFEFVLIGPDVHEALANSGLLKHPNIHWMGKQPYADIPAWLAGIDVAIIPFKLGPITHATSPLKLFEYFAAGKPVVITPMEESQQYPGVLTADDAETFARQLDKALTLTHDPAYLEQITALAQENTWQARAQLILKAMDQT